MGTMKEHPRYHVVSMRVSDEEKEMLLQMRRIYCKSVSDIMREALLLSKPDLHLHAKESE